MKYEVENAYKLVILFTATLLSAHLLALFWIDLVTKLEAGTLVDNLGSKAFLMSSALHFQLRCYLLRTSIRLMMAS